jgi:hypothetical protein
LHPAVKWLHFPEDEFDRYLLERKSAVTFTMKFCFRTKKTRTTFWIFLAQLWSFQGDATADQRNKTLSDAVGPTLSYSMDEQKNRHLIFMNNPEFLWFGREECDLADQMPRWRKMNCARSLFRIEALEKGKYRAWWEHRNMMPFAVQSGILISNNTNADAQILVENDAIETDSFKRGGLEFVQLFNSPGYNSEIKLAPGERKFIGRTTSKSVRSGNFFAGVVDFEIISGSVTIDEVVFKDQPADILTHIGYSNRTLFKVHESLVYKGVSNTSAVKLVGAEFEVDDNTPSGDLPLNYRMADIIPHQQQDSTCRPDRNPACSGSALKLRNEPQQSTSWVTHIAPDPEDSNPKRKRAILSDLVELALPGSTPECRSSWPQRSSTCMLMSHNHFWFLNDFQKWKLPNWGNWGVIYSHPIKIKNNGYNNRFVKVYITADGASPLAFRGTGIGNDWQQVFLDPRSAAKSRASVMIARARLLPMSETQVHAEFVLSGPGAGTLEHRVELMDSEDD